VLPAAGPWRAGVTMSSAERVAAAIADGRLSVREGEILLGFVGLVDVTPPGDAMGARWSRATFYRRLQQLRELGLDVA